LKEVQKVDSESYLGAKEDLWSILQEWPGIYVGVSLDPFLPERWSRSNWEYVALLLGPSDQTGFERQFICKSGSKNGDRRKARGGPLVWLFQIEDLTVGSFVEVRTGPKMSTERYQRIYRLDPLGWSYLAYRQEDVSGWDRYVKNYKFRRFYPWELIVS
jgi:hypothetical protein